VVEIGSVADAGFQKLSKNPSPEGRGEFLDSLLEPGRDMGVIKRG
jgi:hypothetical protein